MTMMKVLVVDDEAVTRKGLIGHIDWEALGVGSVTEAKDGHDALNIARELLPDIVISDVRMPHLNGLEFARALKNTQPKVKFIFLSGFSDKAYLKDAIRLDAVNYVEKPIDLAELTEAMQKAVSLCKHQELEDEKSRKLNTLERNSLPFIKQTIVSQLISGQGMTAQLLSNLQLANLTLGKHAPYIVLVLRGAAHAHSLILHTLETAPKSCKLLSAESENRYTVILYEFDPSAVPAYISDFFGALVREFPQSGPRPGDFFCTVGCPVNSIEEIAHSYNTALALQKTFFFYGYDQLVFHSEEALQPFVLPANFKSDFVLLLKEQCYEALEDQVKSLCRWFSHHKGTPISQVKGILFDVMDLIFREAKARGVCIEALMEENSLWESISSAQTLSQLQEEALGNMGYLFAQQKKLDATDKSIASVLRYIHQNYQDPGICVKSLAAQVYLTSTYLSALFKKETGETISDYLVNVRVEQSKKLLLDPGLKLIEVSQKVGYLDPNYFSKVFRKHVGLSPSVYRERYSHYEE